MAEMIKSLKCKELNINIFLRGYIAGWHHWFS